jgi:hypothetical protein
MEAQETITVNDKEYNVNDLSEAATHYIKQSMDLQEQRAAIALKLEQINIALDAFNKLAIEEVEKEYEEVPEEELPPGLKKK